MSKRNVEIINYVRNNVMNYIKDFERIKRNQVEKSVVAPVINESIDDDDCLVSDLVSAYEKVIGYTDGVSDKVGATIDENMSEYVEQQFLEYNKMKQEMKSSVASSVATNLTCDKEDVTAVIELMDLLHIFSSKEEFDATQYVNVEMLCNLFYSNPNEFYDMVIAPVKEVLENLKKKETIKK